MLYKDAAIFLVLIHAYIIMQRRILAMYNRNKLIGTVKSLIRPNGVHYLINATILNICQWTFDAVSILNVYEAALTDMISVNTNDVQHSEISSDYHCEDV